MQRKPVLILVLLCLFTVTSAEPDTWVRASKGIAIATTARKYIGSELWLYTSSKGPFSMYTNKCSLFVADVLKEADADAPNRYMLYTPIGAGEWGNPHSDYLRSDNCWTNVASPYLNGDVIAYAGHVGIVTGVNKTTGASARATPQGKIVENDWGFRGNESPVGWRYIC